MRSRRASAGRRHAPTGRSCASRPKSASIANFADFCNDCGNCDVFCPEDGGPYVLKPRFFGTVDDWRSFSHLDGFAIDRDAGGEHVYGRIDGHEFELVAASGHDVYSGAGFRLELGDTPNDLDGEATGEVDLTYAWILRAVREAVYRGGAVQYASL